MIIDCHTHIGKILTFDMPETMLLDSMDKYHIDFALVSNIEGAEFDEETRARVNQIGDRIAASQEARVVEMSYADVQRLDALRDAARNQSGAAGAGMAIGAGVALGGSLAGVATSAPSAAASIESRLATLQQLLDKKLISTEEYEAKRQRILETL